ncbi:MAG: hypothetical protein H7A51_04360 [Akkermansiaceae bacterium]|nr:hypothetical protein [Akkermansiaceae bacterium]
MKNITPSRHSKKRSLIKSVLYFVGLIYTIWEVRSLIGVIMNASRKSRR